MLISSLQSNFSGEVFTHFKRIANYQLRDREDLRRELAHFLKSHKLTKDLIVLGIPRRDIILRYLDLPAEVADNLKQVVQYQVQSFEPTEEDRFYYDYAVLNTNGSKKRLSVLLAMVKKTLLDEHLQLLIALGIRPTFVTGSSMALSNMFLRGRKDVGDKIFVLADLSSSSMELLALRYGTLAYSREVPKQNNQRWGDLTLRELNEATSKTRLGPEDTLETIVLAGESADVAQAEIAAVIPDCELLKNAIDIAVPAVNRPHVQEAASSLGLAYTGLARRPPIKMNFLPEELRIRQARWAYVPAVILGLAVLVLFAGLGFHRTIQNQRLIRKLDREIESLKGPVERVQSLRSQSGAIEARIRSLEERLRNKDRNLEILRELTTLLPTDTYLTTYTYRNGTIQLAGSSASAPKLIAELEKSPLLNDVTQKGGIFKEPQTGKDRFSFEAKVER
jgi:Tfp pilus assembly protein PilN